MAKVTGIKCDVCNNISPTLNDSVLQPLGWSKVMLPHDSNARHDDYGRDVCSNKCGEKLFKERRLANGEVDETKPTRKKYPSEGKRPVLQSDGTMSTMEPGLFDFLADAGVTPYQRGPLALSHVRGRHEATSPRPGCLICEYATQRSAK